MSLCTRDVGLNNLNPLIYFTHSQFCNIFYKDLLDEVKLLLYLQVYIKPPNKNLMLN
jgi:hypothetical protein